MTGITRAVIIDDEPEAIQKLKIELARIGNISVVKSTTNPLNTLEIIKDKKPDLVFLDVQMPQKNGLEVLREIAANELNCTVIMVTAFSDFMLEAFRNTAFDYLLKPVDGFELEKVLTRYNEKNTEKVEKVKVDALMNELNRKIRIPSTYETHFLDPEQILFFKADGKYTEIELINGKHLITSYNLGAVERLLPLGKFYRISKSYIINIQYLVKVDRKKKNCIISKGEYEKHLPYSKLYINRQEQIL